MVKRPAVSLAVAFMAGALAARHWPETASFAWCGWLAAFLFLIVPFLLRRRTATASAKLPDEYAPHILPVPGPLAKRGMAWFVLAACVLALALGMHRQARWSERFEQDRRSLPEGEYFDAVLVTLAPNRHYEGQRGRWRSQALVISANGADVSVPASLWGDEGPAARRGDLVRARLRRSPNRPRAFPGAFDVAGWLERDGLALSLSIAKPFRAQTDKPAYEALRLDSPTLFLRLRRAVDSVRSRAIAATLAHGDGDMGPMLAAMLFGYRDDMDSSTRDIFRRVGIGHVLAISGLHVGLVVGLLWWLSGWFGLSARIRAIACLLLALVYLGLSGGQVAAARAAAMAVIHLAGLAWGRKSDMLNSLGLAALILTAINPSAPSDISFQLSFTAVVFIHLALNRDKRPEPPRPLSRQATASRRLFSRLARELSALTRLSVATWLGLFPIIMTVFHQVNLIGLPINIAVIPLMSLVLAGGLLLPWLGWIPGLSRLLVLPGKALLAIARWADQLPHSSLPAHAPQPAWLAVFYSLFILLLFGGYARTRRVRLAWNVGCWLAIAVASLGIVFSARSVPPPPGGGIALLPGWKMDVAVVEEEGGKIAIVGDPSRDGLREANWLHYRKRSGPAAVFGLDPGNKPEDYPALAYHSGIASFRTLGPEEAEGTMAIRSGGWVALPGMDETEIAVSRDRAGRVVWVALRTGGQTVCLAGNLGSRQLEWRFTEAIPGTDAGLLTAGARGKGAVPDPRLFAFAGIAALREFSAGNRPSGWFDRDAWGAIRAANGKIQAFNGTRWIQWERPPGR